MGFTAIGSGVFGLRPWGSGFFGFGGFVGFKGLGVRVWGIWVQSLGYSFAGAGGKKPVISISAMLADLRGDFLQPKS